MPTVPLVRPDDWRGVQLPSVMSVDARPLARGGHILARGMMDMAEVAGAGAQMLERMEERKRQEQEMALVADWRLESAKSWDGVPADESGQGAERGARDFGVDDGSATAHMRQAWRNWRDNPEGLWAKADPVVRRRAELALRMESEGAFIQAARKDVAVEEERRKVASEAALGAAEQSASAYAYNDDLFERSAGQAAEQYARIKSTRLIKNPAEMDGEKLEFVLDEGRQVYEGHRQEAYDKLVKARAVRIIADAGDAESEPLAVARMRVAEQVIEGLTPERKAEARAALESVKAKRLDGMLGLARAADDLDQRERLADVVLEAAREYKPDGKLLGAVKSEVARIREGAQREENHLALSMMAQGGDYEGYMGAAGKNKRRKQAQAWASAKMEQAREKEAREAQSEQARQLAQHAQYVGAMLGSGLWLDEDGKVISVTPGEARDLLTGQLAAGQIRTSDFRQALAGLESKEKSGKKERYMLAAQLVSEGLGLELGMVWRNGRLELAKDDQQRGEKTALKYKVETPVEKLERVREYTNVAYTEAGLVWLEEPREIERTVVKRSTTSKKMKLLYGEIPKLIDLLVVADEVNGLMLDLDHNPATPDKKMDAAAYRRELISDLKKGVVAIDLDAQAEIIYDAAMQRQQDRDWRMGRALMQAAMRDLPDDGSAGAGGISIVDDQEDDDE